MSIAFIYGATAMIDLQIHTNATPHHASWEPVALVEHALEQGLYAIAITDHNTTANVVATQAAGERLGLEVVPGVEIDSGFAAQADSPIPTKLWHTLIYGAPADHPELLKLCESVFSRNQEDAARLRVLLRERGFKLPGLDALGRPANVADVGAALGRANAIPREASDDDEVAGMRYILTQIDRGYQPIDVGEVIAVAHRCGGVAILAHPGRSKGIYAIPASEQDIAAMATHGLDGIEVFYPAHSATEQARLLALARKYDLLITGGSDSHHPDQPLAAWPLEPIVPFLMRVGVVQ
jgi:3',5'-nucleoside bisphosphate phosphatase